MRFFAGLVCGILFSFGAHAAEIKLLNVSYDPTREFYEEYNVQFAQYWKEKTGDVVKIRQSHGGSGKQARAVIDGLSADVVTLALGYDIDAIAEKTGKIPADWAQKLPYNSTPYTSTIVFLVRKGNPKHIKDWADLVRDGVSVLTPNPKTSGGARWNYLAAYGYALEANKGDEAAALTFMKKLFANVPTLDTGARAATTSFAQRGLGDVLITWENEAYLAKQEIGAGQFEIIYPSISILAEPSVAVVEGNAKQNGTMDAAVAYLQRLYDAEAQALAAKHFFRPRAVSVMAQNKEKFPDIRMKTIVDSGGWRAADAKHFADGGTFDQIYGK